MKILVTGGAGFIGSHIVLALVKQPQNSIYNVDKLSYCSDLRNLKECNNLPNYQFIYGNLCDTTFVLDLFEKFKFDAVIHLAAESHVSNSFQAPIEVFENNVKSTQSLLEACRKSPVRRFLYVSTDEVYGGDNTTPVSEDTILRPTNPYSASKAACEHIVNAYKTSFKIPVVVVRLNNVYGPHQHKEKVIPRFISALLHGDKCTIEGSGKQKRNFLYIADAVDGVLTVFQKGVNGEVYNIGTEFNITIIDLVKLLLEQIQPKGRIVDFIEYIKDRPHNDLVYPIDSSKLQMLGWSVQVGWEQGIKQSIEWYQQQLEKINSKL
ncbi:DTDP-D-glucose 4,6-dehydratase [Oopsacas minuta]|uniref:dTDP-D-glucose 4,6-dehydratase n=1 Tax=Oopsacas minuta TaxID=111878 RepID=A0AAV7K8B0_9METZ|nr:DTDP-D-glucose 4,6-dehydratase [Oopsacas minuta]